LTRPSRDEPLQFAILGGFERGFGIFISRVERGTKAEEIGLKRGDQVINIYLLTYIFLVCIYIY
jgi:Rap guanine nucleotide exchange factor 2